MVRSLALILALATLLAGCARLGGLGPVAGGDRGLSVVATNTFLADIAQNVAGDRLKIASLLPVGVDPHGFEPTPSDVRRVADCDVLIVHGQGLEDSLSGLLSTSRRPNATTVEASAGLVPKQRGQGGEADMHYWMDPNLALTYVENIKKGFSAADPDGAGIYEANARAYSQKLKDLDAWIRGEVSTVPPGRRLLVTNHEELGYYADRYGFQVVGAVVPSVNPESSPSAQSLAGLAEQIKKTGAPAVFLEEGDSRQLAEQVARESGAKLAPGLYTHYLSDPKGPAPTYVDMLKYDTTVIVQALR